MKLILFVLPLVLAVQARPQQTLFRDPQLLSQLDSQPQERINRDYLVPDRDAQVIRFDRKEPDASGRSGVSYATDHGVQVAAVTQPDEDGYITQRGSYSYYDVNGQRIVVNYVADRNGYWADVPIPADIPPHAAEQLRRGREEHQRQREYILRLRESQKRQLQA